MNFIDTHFHLDLWENPLEISSKIEEKQIYTIAVTNAPSVFEFSHNLTKELKYIRAALGLHPELVFERYNEIKLFKQFLNLTKYIGEVGLDFSQRNISSKQKQIEIFEQILTCCAESGDKVLTIHSRKAESFIIDMIGNNFPGKIILHWFSGTNSSIEKAIRNEYYFSINSRMIKSDTGISLIKKIPVDRLLTETDGPFIFENNKKCSPLNVEGTISNLASLLSIDPLEMKQIVYSNFKSILNS